MLPPVAVTPDVVWNGVGSAGAVLPLSGFVDAADYTVWRDNLDLMVTLPGDTTPGMVTQADYDVWKNAFGNPMAIGALGGVPVPEPATLGLAFVATALGGCLVLRRR